MVMMVFPVLRAAVLRCSEHGITAVDLSFSRECGDFEKPCGDHNWLCYANRTAHSLHRTVDVLLLDEMRPYAE